MALQTSISWLDRELEDRQSCYIRCRNRKIRQKILARTVSYSVQKGDTLLLSFTNSRKGFWSFDFNQLLGDCRALSRGSDLKKRLQIERINTMGHPEEGKWQDIMSEEYTTVIGDRITHLKTGNLEKYSALDRTAEKLDRLQENSPLLILDREPIYRRLAESLETIIELEKDEEKIFKKTYMDGNAFEENIEPGEQRKITEYARVPAQG